MNKGVACLFCVLNVALSQVSIENAVWRGNVCKTMKVEYLQERYCNSPIGKECAVHRTKLMSRASYSTSCCPEWNHNGDQNCNIHNDELGRNSLTDMTEKTPPLSENDFGRNSTADITDTVSALFLTYILPSTAVILTCFSCGFVAYKSQKRFCKTRNIIRIPAEDILPGAYPANIYEIGMADIDINPDTRYWTIGEDNTVGPRTIEDNTGAPKNPDLGSTYCQIEHNNPPDKLKKNCLQSYEDAYLHPI